MTRRLYILLPGIRTDPADWRNWAPRMATEINLRCPHAKAEEFRYFACAITPKGKQDERARYVVDLALRFFSRGYSVVVVAHSNGANIAVQAAQIAPAIFEAFHLFAPACPADFEKNGLNRALGTAGIVGHCTIYTGTRDWVLQWMARAGAVLGYGDLGFVGPKRVDWWVQDRVTVVPSGHGHGDWFEGANFESTFLRITAEEEKEEGEKRKEEKAGPARLATRSVAGAVLSLLLFPLMGCQTWSLSAEPEAIDYRRPVEELPVQFRATVGGRF